MTMTKREALKAIKTLFDVVIHSEVGEEFSAQFSADLADIYEYCDKEIAHMDKALAARSSRPTKASIENKPIKEAILAILKEYGGKTSADLTLLLQTEFEGIKVQKVSAVCRQLSDEGAVSVEEIKVPKKGKQKLYTVVSETEQE